MAAYPNNPVLQNNLAVLLEASGDVQERKQCSASALAEDAALPQVSKNLADIFYRNGRYAGKTTFMNAVSGFVRARGGVVFGTRLDQAAPHRRARLGIGRGFQNAELFGGLTVRETLMVSLEARPRSARPIDAYIPPSPSGGAPQRREAEEIIGYLGLDRYADTLISGSPPAHAASSSSPRCSRSIQADDARRADGGCRPKRDRGLWTAHQAGAADLGCRDPLIEHDMPMVMSISDRIYCLEAGRVIAEGKPGARPQRRGAIVLSYLGTDTRAIDRSGPGGGHMSTETPARVWLYAEIEEGLTRIARVAYSRRAPARRMVESPRVLDLPALTMTTLADIHRLQPVRLTKLAEEMGYEPSRVSKEVRACSCRVSSSRSANGAIAGRTSCGSRHAGSTCTAGTARLPTSSSPTPSGRGATTTSRPLRASSGGSASAVGHDDARTDRERGERSPG